MKDEIDKAVIDVIDSTSFIMGGEVKELEQEFASYIKTEYALGVSSGTDALLVALMALGIGAGDEVITTPFTFIATAEVIALLGAVPVFVDIEKDTYNIDTTKIKEKITSKTRAIIPVHLYGQSADLDEILNIAKAHNLYVIEDVAQATGAVYKGRMCGSIGDIGCFSFFPSKNLGCYGDGGMITTNNKELRDKMDAIRIHGSEKKYEHTLIGLNARLDTIQAAIVRVKLKYFKDTIKKREEISKIYLEKLSKIDDIKLSLPKDKDRNHTYNQFTIRTEKRDDLNAFLNEKGIPTAIHYPCSLHLQEAFEYLGYKKGDFPESEKAAEQVLSLPMFPLMKEEQMDKIVEAIIESRVMSRES